MHEPSTIAKIPPVPLALGLAGLIPFWALALTRVLGFGFDPLLVSLALSAYAATILAFLGGIRWGLAMSAEAPTPRTREYIIGVLPQLVGWGALILAERWRFVVLALALLILGPLDRRLVARGLAPVWFGRLRLILSLGAGAALLVAALA